MAIIKDRSFSASKTSMEFKIVETDSVSSTIKISFHCGNNHLDYTFFVLQSDLMMLHTLILRNWMNFYKQEYGIQRIFPFRCLFRQTKVS